MSKNNKDNKPNEKSKVSEELIRKLRDTPCETQEDLKQWILYFLKLDVPDFTLCEDSNSNPMHMIWTVYKNMVHYNKLPPEEKANKFLFYATRGGWKTINAAILEILAAIHDHRGTAHIAAAESHVEKCYNDYFQKFAHYPYLKELVKSSVMSKTIFNLPGEPSVGIMPCTRRKVQGEHKPFVCVAEGTQIQVIEYSDEYYKGREIFTVPIEKVYDWFNNGRNFKVFSLDHKNKKTVYNKITSANKSIKECLEITLNSGNKITATPDHRFWNGEKYSNLSDFKIGDSLYRYVWSYVPDIAPDLIKNIQYVGHKTVYDINVENSHNFFANNILVHNCKDEIDVVEDISAYNDIDGIPIDMPDKRPPITMGISVRKSGHGLVQKEIDSAPEKGVKVFHWNLIDITEKCPDSRSGKKKTNFYVKRGTLQSITEDRYKSLAPGERQDYDMYEGRENCLTNCRMFGACRGRLKNQQSKSTALKSIDYTEGKFTESADEQMMIAQFLCEKPPATGLIYLDYDPERNEKTYSQMWEIFTKQKPDHEITKEELVNKFHQHNVTCIFGVDWGFDPDPTVVLAIFIDRAKNIYVVDEFVAIRTTEADVAHWLSDPKNPKNWKALYNPHRVYPDLSSPGGRRELQKKGFICAASKRFSDSSQEFGSRENVIKDVKAGISTVRKFLRIPATTITKIFINKQSCPTLCFEFPRYHNKTSVDGEVTSDKPADRQHDHALDSFRYAIHSYFSNGVFNFAFMDGEDNKGRQTWDHTPSYSELAQYSGVNFIDNSKPEENEIDEFLSDDDGFNDDNNGGGFGFNF